jgi:hypothetical protein
MADVVQVESFSPKLFPFNRYKDQVGVSAAVPWGQAVIDNAFVANAIGAGDTGTLALDIRLPANYCCLMRSLHLSAYDVSSILWTAGIFGMAYQLPGGPYKNSMLTLPETDFLWWPLSDTTKFETRNRSSVTYNNKAWSFGEVTTTTDSGSSGSPGADNPMNIPMWISPDYPGANIVIYLENDTASTGAIDFRFNAVFDIYDQQQAFAPEVMASPRRLAT